MRGLLATTAAFTLNPCRLFGAKVCGHRGFLAGRLGPQRRLESDHQLVWDPLRSHPPNLRLDGSEPVTGRLATRRQHVLGCGPDSHVRSVVKPDDEPRVR